MRPLRLAGRAKIVVGTNGTLEASSNHGSLTAITGDARVQDLRRDHRRGRGVMSPRWGRRVAKAKRGESMKRKVSAVLLLLWKRSEKQMNSFCCLVPTHQPSAPPSVDRVWDLRVSGEQVEPVVSLDTLARPKFVVLP